MVDLLPFRSPIVNSPAETAVSPLVVDARRLAMLLNSSIRTVRTWENAGKLPQPVGIGGGGDLADRRNSRQAWYWHTGLETWAAIRAAHK